MEWIEAPAAMRKLILWMYGPAGSGKTAIAQSIAEACQQQGRLAASFFFGRTAHGRNDTTRFIATIAYQLSRFMPETCDCIMSAIEQNPAVFFLRACNSIPGARGRTSEIVTTLPTADFSDHGWR
jgi:RecA/RadA recombinase